MISNGLTLLDQIKYYEVTEAELDQFRADFANGVAEIKIEETEFDFAADQAFLETEKDSIAEFKASKQQAFTTEVECWKGRLSSMYSPAEMEIAGS